MSENTSSPQSHAPCHCGQIHRLGGTDCHGEQVGWIEDNVTYRDERERDLCRATGRFHEEWRIWNLTGGTLGSEPDKVAIAQRLCRNPDNIDEAVREMVEETDPNDPVNRAIAALAARRASMN